DHRDAFGVCRLDQRLDVFERHPGLLTTGRPPALDGLQDWFRLLAAERPIDVDHEQRRSLSEPSACPKSARREYGLVALSKKFVPDPLSHQMTSSVRHGMHSGPFRSPRQA